MSKIYLASKSPRRKELFKKITTQFSTFHIETAEELLDGEHPSQTVKRIARHKMEAAVNKRKQGIIITADTIVVIDKKVLGKPKNKKDAFEILKSLSGKKHYVYTGYAILDTETGQQVIDYEKTEVKFNSLSERDIKKYVATGEPMDKAGAYGIQDDLGSLFVEKINGCYYNVMGLPVAKLYKSLKEFINCWEK